MTFRYKTEPFKHQKECFDKLYGKTFGAEFMEQGTGKSKVAIDIASNLFIENKINAVLLIAPNNVHTQWAKEQIPCHSSVPTRSFIWGLKKNKLASRILEEFIFNYDERASLRWFCVNVEAFSLNNHLPLFKEFVQNNNTMIIVDEATRIKNPTSNRTINVCYNLCNVTRRRKRIVAVAPLAKYRLILTGTMITNNPFDLWSMFEFLQHNYFNMNYYAFKARYGLEIRDMNPHTGGRFNRKITKSEIDSILRYNNEGKSIASIAAIMATSESNIKFILEHPNINIPYKNLSELKRLIEPVSFIVRKKDCLDIPPKVYETVYVNMNTDQKRIYKELIRDFLSNYDDKELTVKNKLTLTLRLQQVSGGFFPYNEETSDMSKIVLISKTTAKLESIKNDLYETSGDEKIIIWAVFTGELLLLYNKLKKEFPDKTIELYYGKTSHSERERIKTSFKNGLVDILIANPSTAGIGLNLQISHFNMVYSNSFSLEKRLQFEDRTHRIGTTESVLYKDYVCKETVDEKILKVLKQRKDLLDYFRDNSITEFLG